MRRVADRALDIAMRTAFGVCSPAGTSARLQILIFHRVVSQRDPLFPEEVDRDGFDAICAWLARWMKVLPLDEAAGRLARGSLPARAVAITFDDGYADNHDVALPVLRAHGLTATFFVATDFLDGGRMWNDTVIEAVRRCQRESIDLTACGLPDIAELDLSANDARRGAIDRVLRAAKYLPDARRLASIERLAAIAAVPLPADLMMSAHQVRALARSGMQVGAHTATHPILARLDDRGAREEICRGKARLESIIGSEVTLFAYPNGYPGRDYLSRDVDVVRRLGFRAAVSTSPGVASPAFRDVFQLPRFTPWNRTSSAFGRNLLLNLLRRPVSV